VTGSIGRVWQLAFALIIMLASSVSFAENAPVPVPAGEMKLDGAVWNTAPADNPSMLYRVAPMPPMPRAPLGAPAPKPRAPLPGAHIPSLAVPSPMPKEPGLVPQVGGTWISAPAVSAAVGLCNPLLLRDGSVIAHNCAAGDWWKLTPDFTGNYANGTWTQTASLPSGYGPLYNSSAVLGDGKLIVQGGEYNSACHDGSGNLYEVWTSLGAIYDPAANIWTAVSPPTSGAQWVNTDACGTQQANGGVGDAQSIVLPNGTFMLGACCANPSLDALFNETGLSWTGTGAPSTYQDEQGYTLLQNGKVLTIDVWDSLAPNVGVGTQIYDPGSSAWSAGPSTTQSLVDPCGNYEIGPALMRPDGSVVAFGGNTAGGANNASCASTPGDPTQILTSGAWAAGPQAPFVCGTGGNRACNLGDAPAALLPSGNILFGASSGYGETPVHFFEFTTANTIQQVSDPPNAATSANYYYNFLVLPSGQIFVTDFSNIAKIYTPTGSASSGWAPTITAAPAITLSQGNNFALSGTQFAGLSQGAAYGDDNQSTTNYPIVKITNTASGHVNYARTLSSSTFSIAPGAAGATTFALQGLEAGPSTLSVVANGIPSAPVNVSVQRSLRANAPYFAGTANPPGLLWRNATGGAVSIWNMNSSGGVSGYAGGQQVTNDWLIAGVGDFNNDGVADILWRNINGTVGIWFMNANGTVKGYGGGQSVPAEWILIGTGDFNGDGVADILWRDTNGTIGIWFMNADGSIKGYGGGQAVANSWNVAGLGDFNKDGVTDILWRNTNGTVGLWFMNPDGSIKGYGGGQSIPAEWTILGTGDFNRDGVADVLWRDTNGTIEVWFMNTDGSAKGYGGGQAVPNSWSIVGVADFNQDGVADILWQNVDGTIGFWFMNADGSIKGYGGGQVVSPANWWLVQ
jgi:hypothetical protein